MDFGLQYRKMTAAMYFLTLTPPENSAIGETKVTLRFLKQPHVKQTVKVVVMVHDVSET